MGQHILSTAKPWDLVAPGYNTEVVPVFRQFAKDAIAALQLKPQDRVLDVATGPGTIPFMIAKSVREVVAVDFSNVMLATFKQELKRNPQSNIEVKQGDGQALEEDSASYDAVFSQFGLMFFPNRTRGFSEVYRVLKKGGRTAITAWAPISESPAMLMSLGALAAGFPEAQASAADVRLSDGLDNLSVFQAEMRVAGFQDIRIDPITHAFPVPSAAAFWNSMCRGSAPINLMRLGMTPERWDEGEKAAIAFLEKELPHGPTSLGSTAYLGVGWK